MSAYRNEILSICSEEVFLYAEFLNYTRKASILINDEDGDAVIKLNCSDIHCQERLVKLSEEDLNKVVDLRPIDETPYLSSKQLCGSMNKNCVTPSPLCKLLDGVDGRLKAYKKPIPINLPEIEFVVILLQRSAVG